MSSLRAVVIIALVAWATLLPACVCAPPCSAVPEETALSYADEEAWVCRPGRDDACARDLATTEIAPDGTRAVVPHERAESPEVDCFWIYPTLDLRLGLNVQTSFANTSRIEDAVAAQAARFSEVCAVYAPLYRQATVGTYLGDDEAARDRCFDVAFADVQRAFERFLSEQDEPRPFVLAGHSQGAQMVARLVREVVEPDAELLSRLITVMPIGWPIGTDGDARTGGSFERVPTCASAAERGCVVGYRSFIEGDDIPAPAAAYREGTRAVCSEIADPDDTGDDRLARVWLPWDNALVAAPDGIEPMTETVLYRDAFAARCIDDDAGDPALEWRWAPDQADSRENPVDFERARGTGSNGAHLFDLHFGQGALIDLVRAKAAP